MTADPGQVAAALVRVAGAVAWAVIVLLWAPGGWRRRVGFAMLAAMLGCIAVGGLVPVLDLQVPPGFLSTLYTVAAGLALILALLYMLTTPRRAPTPITTVTVIGSGSTWANPNPGPDDDGAA